VRAVRFVLVLLVALAVLACRAEPERAPAPAPASAPARSAAPPTVRVLAVPSVDAAVRAAASAFQARHGGVTVTIELAAPALIRARLGGASKADVVVVEGELGDGPGIAPGSARRVGQSALFAVRSRRADEIEEPSQLPKASFPHFVLPDPALNASGAAAKAWLEGTQLDSGSLFAALEPRLLPQRDAQAALAELERRGRTMGIVLALDLATAKTIKPLFELPGEPVPFTAAVVAGHDRQRAAAFVTLLVERGLGGTPDAAK
jgi:hypothetical protein